MPTERTEAEVAALAAEAEQRVRRGERHADVAEALGIPSSTLSDWARRGRWRRKDLAFERDMARGRLALAEIEQVAARTREAVLKQAAETKEIAATADAAMAKADPEGDGRPTGLVAVTAPQLSMAMAEKLLQQGRLDDAERAARFALQFSKAQQAVNEPLRTEWLQDRARIFKWWEENSSALFALQQRVASLIKEAESNAILEGRLAEKNCCPACTRPMDFWPPELEEECDRIAEELEAEKA
jgi:hypothetical protein